MVGVSAHVVAHGRLFVGGQFGDAGNQCFCAERLIGFGQRFHNGVGVVDIGLMVFAVVDFHGHRIKMRF